MNTPGTEWETEFEEKFLNDALDAFPEHPQTMALFLINIKTFIATLLTSRDTYWKERVQSEYGKGFEDGLAAAHGIHSTKPSPPSSHGTKRN